MSRLASTVILVVVCASLAVSAAAQVSSPVDSARVGLGVPPAFDGGVVIEVVPPDSLVTFWLSGKAVSLPRFGGEPCASADIDPGMLLPPGPLDDPDPGIVIEPRGDVDPHIVLFQPPGVNCWNGSLRQNRTPEK